MKKQAIAKFTPLFTAYRHMGDRRLLHFGSLMIANLEIPPEWRENPDPPNRVKNEQFLFFSDAVGALMVEFSRNVRLSKPNLSAVRQAGFTESGADQMIEYLVHQLEGEEDWEKVQGGLDALRYGLIRALVEWLRNGVEGTGFAANSHKSVQFAQDRVEVREASYVTAVSSPNGVEVFSVFNAQFARAEGKVGDREGFSLNLFITQPQWPSDLVLGAGVSEQENSSLRDALYRKLDRKLAAFFFNRMKEKPGVFLPQQLAPTKADRVIRDAVVSCVERMDLSPLSVLDPGILYISDSTVLLTHSDGSVLAVWGVNRSEDEKIITCHPIALIPHWRKGSHTDLVLIWNYAEDHSTFLLESILESIISSDIPKLHNDTLVPPTSPSFN